MNERIRELEKQCQEYRSGFAGQEDWYTVFNKQKFAELIVRECAVIATEGNSDKIALDILVHFGVEQ